MIIIIEKQTDPTNLNIVHLQSIIYNLSKVVFLTKIINIVPTSFTKLYIYIYRDLGVTPTVVAIVNGYCYCSRL